MGFFSVILSQIEGILRDLLHKNAISIYKEKRENVSVQEYLLVGEILAKCKKNNLLSNDLIRYLEIHLYDPIYLNIRHKSLHGFYSAEGYNSGNCNVLLFILLQIVGTAVVNHII